MKKLFYKYASIIMTLILTAGFAKGEVYNFTEGNRLTLLQNAHTSTELKIDLVKHAKHHIHIVTYYWDNKGYPIELMNELKKAHARGVDVRLMSTYVPSATLDFFGKARRTLDIRHSKKESDATLAYLRLVPGHNESWTNNIHEKIFLVDGEVAILGGRNISDNDYRAKDLEVKLEGPVVNEVQEHFRRLFNFLVDLKILTHCQQNTNEGAYDGCFDKYNDLRFAKNDLDFFPEQTVYPEGSKARILTNEVLFTQFKDGFKGKKKFTIKDDIINTVTKIDFNQLRAYNYFILPTVPYRAYLEKNLKEKKDIRVISNSLKSSAFVSSNGYYVSLPEMKGLVDDGLPIAQWNGSENLEYLHEKVMLFDEDHAIVGSHNYGAGSTSVSSEICVEFFDRPIVQTLSKVFDAEFADPKITTRATSESVRKEMDAHKYMIKFLRINFIETILKMLY
jgi:putative cardiolipin synthase